jgi:predicted nucleic acid-binding protein
LSVKLRNKQLDAQERNAALALFVDLLRSITIAPITSAIFQEAAMLATVSTSGLRAGDALHLSVARMSGKTLITFDRKLAFSATELGLKSIMP